MIQLCRGSSREDGCDPAPEQKKKRAVNDEQSRCSDLKVQIKKCWIKKKLKGELHDGRSYEQACEGQDKGGGTSDERTQ